MWHSIPVFLHMEFLKILAEYSVHLKLLKWRSALGPNLHWALEHSHGHAGIGVPSLKELSVLCNSGQNGGQEATAWGPGKENLQTWGTEITNFLEIPWNLLCAPALNHSWWVFSALRHFPAPEHMIQRCLFTELLFSYSFLQLFTFLPHWNPREEGPGLSCRHHPAPSCMPGASLSNKPPALTHVGAWMSESWTHSFPSIS